MRALTLIAVLFAFWCRPLFTEELALLDFGGGFTRDATDRIVEGEAVFDFTAKASVDVSVVKTSCGCAEAFLDKFKFTQGETGKVRVLVGYAGRDGLRRETVTLRVVPIEGGGKSVQVCTLVVAAAVPKAVSVAPTSLTWEADDMEKKTLRVETHDKRLRITSAKIVGEEFSLEKIDIIAQGEIAHISVSPRVSEDNRRLVTILQLTLMTAENRSRAHNIILIKKEK